MAKRRIKKAKIRFLSLCPKGKNRLQTVLKDDGAFQVEMLTKGLSAEGELLAVVYAPEFRDVDGDIASAPVVKSMLYESAREGLSLDIRHDNKAIDKSRAFVAEQFIVQKGDPRFADFKDYDGNTVDVTGAWGTVIKIDDPSLRKLYEDGAWKGVSMDGLAQFEVEKSDDTETLLQKFISALTGAFRSAPIPATKEDDMPLSETDLAAIAKMMDEKLAKAAPATPPKPDAPQTPPPAASTAPVFAGDPLSKEDVAKHLEAVKRHDAQERIAKAKTPAEVEAILKSLETGTTPEDETTKRLAALQKEMDTLRGRSQQPPTSGQQQQTKKADENVPQFIGLEKEDGEDLGAIGASMATWSNKERGY